jgi:hypothetical protein
MIRVAKVGYSKAVIEAEDMGRIAEGEGGLVA